MHSGAHAGVSRPAVYEALVTIAERRFDGREPPASYTEAQIHSLLKPLQPLIRNGQLGPRGYRMFADIWAHSATPPDDKTKSLLIEGFASYPLDASLSAVILPALKRSR